MTLTSGGKKAEEFFGTRDAAMFCGCDVTTLRDYEKRGVVAPAKTSTGRRLYTLDDIEQVCRYQRSKQRPR
jgi:DNA-binding transcriptional MerR regulator